MDAAQVIERVSQAKSGRDLKLLVADLADVPAPVIFDALFPVAVREQEEASGPVAMSACALHALNPPCQLSVDDVDGVEINPSCMGRRGRGMEAEYSGGEYHVTEK